SETTVNVREMEDLVGEIGKEGTRNILLIGRVGSGKSTLANVLINEFRENEPFRKLFEESDGSTSKTGEIKTAEFESNGIKYRIIDTPGFGDTKLAKEELLEKIAEVACSLKEEGLSQIFLVAKDRIEQAEADTYTLLKEAVSSSKEMANENI